MEYVFILTIVLCNHKTDLKIVEKKMLDKTKQRDTKTHTTCKPPSWIQACMHCRVDIRRVNQSDTCHSPLLSNTDGVTRDFLVLTDGERAVGISEEHRREHM